MLRNVDKNNLLHTAPKQKGPAEISSKSYCEFATRHRGYSFTVSADTCRWTDGYAPSIYFEVERTTCVVGALLFGVEI